MNGTLLVGAHVELYALFNNNVMEIGCWTYVGDDLVLVKHVGVIHTQVFQSDDGRKVYGYDHGFRVLPH